jgi:hypothetical protein
MHVILVYVPGYYRYSPATASLDKQFFQPSPYFRRHYFVPVFGYPHYVILDIVSRVSCVLIFRHLFSPRAQHTKFKISLEAHRLKPVDFNLAFGIKILRHLSREDPLKYSAYNFIIT